MKFVTAVFSDNKNQMFWDWLWLIYLKHCSKQKRQEGERHSLLCLCSECYYKQGNIIARR